MSEKARCYIRSKLWIEDEAGNVIFGLGRLKMLEAIRQHGSIRAAAQELGMSYRAIWCRIKATEERLGIRLLVRNVGGYSGGGSKLTPQAEQFIEHFRRVHKKIEAESDKLFEKEFSSCLNPDSNPDFQD